MVFPGGITGLDGGIAAIDLKRDSLAIVSAFVNPGRGQIIAVNGHGAEDTDGVADITDREGPAVYAVRVEGIDHGADGSRLAVVCYRAVEVCPDNLGGYG